MRAVLYDFAPEVMRWTLYHRFQGPGQLIAWSRILNDVEVLIAVNSPEIPRRGKVPLR